MSSAATCGRIADGFDSALAMARKAGDGDVDVAGGASAVRRALGSGELDELTLDIVPVQVGAGERIGTPLRTEIFTFPA